MYGIESLYILCQKVGILIYGNISKTHAIYKKFTKQNTWSTEIGR